MGQLSTDVELYGAALSERSATLSFDVAGVVASVAVAEGDEVRTGDALATLDAADAQRRVETADVQLRLAQLRLDNLLAGPESLPSPQRTRRSRRQRLRSWLLSWRSCGCWNPPMPPTWPAPSRRWRAHSDSSPVRRRPWPCCWSLRASAICRVRGRRWRAHSDNSPTRSTPWPCCWNPRMPPTWPARSRQWPAHSDSSPARSRSWPCCWSPRMPPTWPARSRRWPAHSDSSPARSRSWLNCWRVQARQNSRGRVPPWHRHRCSSPVRGPTQRNLLKLSPRLSTHSAKDMAASAPAMR